MSVEFPDYRVPEPNGVVETCLVLNFEASERVSVLGTARNADPVDARGLFTYYTVEPHLSELDGTDPVWICEMFGYVKQYIFNRRNCELYLMCSKKSYEFH